MKRRKATRLRHAGTFVVGTLIGLSIVIAVFGLMN